MLRRNGTKNRSQHPITVNVDKLTRIEKIELFDQLTKNVINAHNRYIAVPDANKVQRAVAKVDLLRSLYRLINHASKLSEAYEDNPLTALNITTENAIEKVCSKLTQTINHITFKSELVKNEIEYIGKIMHRYKLDFDIAFNFLLLRNNLKYNLEYTGEKGSKFGDKIVKLNVDLLLETGKNLGLSEQQIRDTLPTFEVKMNRSCAKSIIARQQAGMFATSAEFNQALADITTSNRSRFG